MQCKGHKSKNSARLREARQGGLINRKSRATKGIQVSQDKRKQSKTWKESNDKNQD